MGFGIDRSPANSSNYWYGELPIKGHTRQLIQQAFQNNNRIHLGLIVDINAEGYVAQVNTGNGICTATWCSESNSSLFGAGSLSIPQLGSRVIVYVPPSGEAMIIGCIPSVGLGGGTLYKALMGSKITTLEDKLHSGVWQKQIGMYPYINGRPLDVYPGDIGWFNEDGGVLGLFRGCVGIIKASDLSQIQVNSIDDTMRLVARNYQFFNAIGETKIYDDKGYVSAELLIGNRLYETFGFNSFEEIGEEKDQNPNGYYQLKDNLPDPIYRTRIFAGWLGDNLRIETLDTEKQGLSKIQINEEGGIFVDTLKNILLRKAKSITVCYKNEDSTNREEEVDNFEWNQGEPSGRVLEEDDFLKYQDEVYSNRNFEGWDEITTSGANKEGFLHIRDDGSIILRSGSGSAIELTTEGDIIISPIRDLIVQPGRDFGSIIPANYNIRAKGHCSINSDEGDIRLRAFRNNHLYSHTGSILLETLGEEKPNKPQKGEDLDSGGIIIRSKGDAPILLETTQNCVQLQSTKNIILYAENDIKTEGNNLYFKSNLFNILSATKQEKLTNLAVQISSNTQISSSSYTLTGNIVNITGTSNCMIHAPSGVDVAHEHPTSEWTYTIDADGFKGHGINILKKNSPVIASPQIDEQEKTEDLIKPWTNDITNNIIFLHREKHRSEPLYYTYWQNFKDTKEWDLGTIDINDTRAYPGLNIIFKEYTSSNSVSNKGGTFSKTNLYKEPNNG